MTHTFSKLGLAEPILKALAAQNFTTPTPIQEKAIPAILNGRDLFGIAQTGTGKTAAFALPIIDALVGDPKAPMRKSCRALVLAPTRELATQIADSFTSLAKFCNLKVATVFGGVGHGPQIRALAGGVDVLVATPGRLIDHLDAGHCDLSGTGIVVLDEADQMLDLGFLKPIRTITAKTSHRRQSLFFSATLPKEIEALAAEMLRDPVSVRVAPVATTAERINQRVLHVARGHKPAILSELLGDANMVRTLVFTRTKRGADRVAKHLTVGGHKVRAIHGNKSQNQRQQALDAFKSSKIHVLVATDIAARGIDISQVSHVVNYDLPEVPESYVHRIGRTARAGHAGEAISLVDPSERGLLRDIERLTRQTIPSERMAAPAAGDGPAAVAALEAAASVSLAEDEDARFERRRGRGPTNGGGRNSQRSAAGRSGQGRRGGEDRGHVTAERGAQSRSNGGERPSVRADDRARGEGPRGDRPRGEHPRADRQNGDRRDNDARRGPRDGGRPGGRGPVRFEDGVRGEGRRDDRPRGDHPRADRQNGDRRDNDARREPRDGGRPGGRGPVRFEDGARGEGRRDDRPRGERPRADRQSGDRQRGDRRDNDARREPRDGGRPGGRGPVRFEDGARGEGRRHDRPRGDHPRGDRRDEGGNADGNRGRSRPAGSRNGRGPRTRGPRTGSRPQRELA